MHPSSAAIGIDIGGTNLRAARVSQTGEILERLAEKVTTRDAALVLDRVGEMARALDRPNVVAIGLGVPGRVESYRDAVRHQRQSMLKFIAGAIGNGVYFHDYGGAACHHGFCAAMTLEDVRETLARLEPVIAAMARE